MAFQISKEIKTAVLVIVASMLFIWGYSFLTGKDIFNSNKKLYVVYDNVMGLAPSAPVTINGLIIGKVNKININPDAKILVEMQINTDFPISKSSIAEIYSSGFVGGKEIAIIPNLNDKSQTISGDYLKPSNKLGIVDEISAQVEPIKIKAEAVLDNTDKINFKLNQVLNTQTKTNLRSSIENLNTTLAEFNTISKSVNSMLAENKSKLNNTLLNFDKTSTNFAKISDTLSNANIAKTLNDMQNSVADIQKMINEIEKGNGTMGKLMKDEKLYTNLTQSTKELELLLQDLRLNPTRYVNVSLFGKKNKPYIAPTIKDSLAP